MIRLLLVDDDAPYRARLAQALRKRGLEVVEAEDPAAALELALASPPQGALVDLRMPGGSGLDLVARLAALEPRPVIVVLTGYGSIPTALEAVRRGAAHVLQKPAELGAILAALRGEVAKPDEAEVPSLDRVEWEHIQRVLADAGGNVSEAARRLGLHRRSLQRKLDRPAPRG
ncbi:MAG TPA: response regulator [Holophagaceae bacterium]|nr:response regulator [Holophagaceae bacterium]HJW33078.1 response regulator [Holophagaceae bacterium]